MGIYIHTISARAPSWVQEGCQEYAERLKGRWSLTWQNTPIKGRSNPKNIAAERQKESLHMLSRIPEQSFVIALEERGKRFDSQTFSKTLTSSLENFRDVHFLLGGPEGLTIKAKERAQQTWSLSELTFPHSVARIILYEQIYRAWSIAHQHPYHNE